LTYGGNSGGPVVINNFLISMEDSAVPVDVEFGDAAEFNLVVANTGHLGVDVTVSCLPVRGRVDQADCLDGCEDVGSPRPQEFQWRDQRLEPGDPFAARVSYRVLRGDVIELAIRVRDTGDSGELLQQATLSLRPSGQQALLAGLYPSPYRGDGPAFFRYLLEERASSVAYRILDLRGVEVANSEGHITSADAISAGIGQIAWDGTGRGGTLLPNGAYFMELIIRKTDGTTETRYQKIALLIDQ
jgi:hypothetical protein